ncbi:uncharacterized protein I206_104628 [Kwoniella pini CBS 10737]|uniref:Beta-lactamase-related domain-containing protein n=1 Tax=Kwoniella pini CBS 10737 TaxID=1296096 RepID=A0A1B9I7K4_9TREE|nr:uncharacterized protein I206_02163 [Kwoniella pini CBS 10737]OCF51449.1 hypothetical protein I206_02163 [Kwoniella pini CBS 10737]
MVSDTKKALCDFAFPGELSSDIIMSMRKNKIHGCHYILVKDDMDVHGSSTVGTIDGKEVLKVEDVFPLVANAQIIRLMALHKALQSNGYDFSTPIKQIIPELVMVEEGVADEINCSDLAAHMSGLHRISALQDKNIRRDNIITQLQSIQPVHSFRSTYHQSDIAEPIFELIIERLSKKDYVAFIREEIFGSLKLKYSTISEDDEQRTIIKSNGRDMLKLLMCLPESPIYEHLFKIYKSNIEYPLVDSTQQASGCLSLIKISNNGIDSYENFSIGNGYADLYVDLKEHKARLAVLCKYPEAGGKERCQEFVSWMRGRLINHLVGLSERAEELVSDTSD